MPSDPGALPFDVCGQEAERAAQAGADVQHRGTDLHRTRPLTAGHAHQAALGLQDQVEPAAGRVRPDVAVARDRAVDDRWEAFMHGLRIQPVGRETSGPGVLDQEVRGGEEPVDRLGSDR